MFKVMIQGKTMIELRTAVCNFLAGLNDSTEFFDPSQMSKREPARLETIPVPEFKAEPARSIPAVSSQPSPDLSKTFPTSSIAPSSIAPSSIATPTVTSPVTAINDYGVDSRGFPWDERIHSVMQGKNKDGSWRNRRGVEPSTLTQVEAEFLSRRSAAPSQSVPVVQPAAPVIPPPPFIPSIVPPSVANPPAFLDPNLFRNVAPIAPPPPAAIPTPTAPASAVQLPAAYTAQTFKENLVPALAKLVNDGKLTQSYISEMKAFFKIDQIWDVSDEQCAQMFEYFVSQGVVVKV